MSSYTTGGGSGGIPQQVCNTNVISIIEAGIVLACSLAWSNTIQLAVKEIYPKKDDGEAVLISQLIYSIILTTVVLLILYQLQTIKNHFT
jgi:hypothetical protein